MRLRIDLKIFIIAILFYLTKQIEIYAILMIFTFMHECGHLIAGMCLGFIPEKINILPIGFSVSFKIPIDYYNKKIKNSNLLSIKKIIIAFAGPLVNLIIVVIFFMFKFGFYETQITDIIYANIILVLFNLIPIYPLDGGQILKQILKIKYGVKNSIRYINIIQNISMILLTMISSIAIVYLQNIAILVIILYLWVITIRENKKYAMYKRIYEYIKQINDV